MAFEETDEVDHEQYINDIQGCAPDCVERTHCPTTGRPMHEQCGFCREHNRSRHHCGCIIREKNAQA